MLAAQAVEAGATGEVLVVSDARRKEIYVERFAASPDHPGDVQVRGELDVLHPSDLVRGDATTLVGPAAALVAGTVGLPAAEPISLDPVVLARLGAARAARGVDQPTEPHYLRRPDAVPPGARKRATG